MIVRELIAVLGIDLDDRDVRKVDNAVSGFEGRMQKVGKFIGGSLFLAGFARLAGATVSLASDAEETLNVIRETFGANAAEVESWSTRVAKEVGRSEFLLREMAGSLGAVLTPMMEGNTEASADMATSLSALAVDLASFFNTSEDDALIALRSGLVGSTEPLLRYGANLQVASLQQFALTKGITKSVQTMTQAEKTALRYEAIMHFTAQAQGDAARTADGYANASRAAADGVKDLATRIGTRLLPVATRFMMWARDAARSLVEVTQKTYFLEAALIVMAAGLGVVALMMLAPFVPFLIIAAKVALAIGAIIIVVDELLTFFSGGKTVIGEFIDELFGIGAAQELLDNLNAGWDEMYGWWQKLLGLGDELGGKLFDWFGDKRPNMSAPTTGGVRHAVGASIDSEYVTSRKGSTGRDLRLKRAAELDAKRRSGKKLTRLESLEMSRITDKGGEFRRESAVAARQRRMKGEWSASLSGRGGEGQGLSAAAKRQQEFNAGFARHQEERAYKTDRGGDSQLHSVKIDAPIAIYEAHNPEVIHKAVQRGIAAAVADAGAATARGSR